jgi:hypothetical protein
MNTRLISMHDVSLHELRDCDLFVSSVAHGPRSTEIAKQFEATLHDHWVIAQSTQAPESLSDQKQSSRRPVCIDADSFGLSFSSWLESREGARPHVCIDISSMSRPAMGAIIEALCSSAELRRISVSVGYSIAAFTPPPTDLPPNEDIRPISNWFSGWPSDANASTSLVVGLGYEQGKAEGACEYFDASETWAFFPCSPIGQYDDAVASNNNALLQRVKRRNRLLRYEVDSPSATFGRLVQTVSELVRTSNPVLLPFGPKIFFIISLLVASLYREVGVWHVTGDIPANELEQPASDHVVAFTFDLGPLESE